MSEQLVLVDENDREVGTEEKLETHRQGKLHRAFSSYIFSSRGELLLTRRAATKYHCGGLWTNTCCGHPRPGEPVERGARRRLREEMGFECDLEPVFQFIYRAEFPNGLTEHELDHVFIGRYDGPLDKVDPNEADAFEWVDPDHLIADLKANPGKYTIWMALSVERAVARARERLLSAEGA